MPKTYLFVSLLLPLALGGCDLNSLASVAGQIATAAGGPSVTVTGKVDIPGTQVAVIAVGAGNYHVAARPDEVGAAQAHVSYAPLALPLPAANAVADSTGHYTLEVGAATTYVVTATVAGKDGQTMTLRGLSVVGIADPGLELDASMNMVASKLLSLGIKQVDESQLQAAVSQMDSDLGQASQTPVSSDQAAAAAAFDRWADAGLKAQVAGMVK